MTCSTRFASRFIVLPHLAVFAALCAGSLLLPAAGQAATLWWDTGTPTTSPISPGPGIWGTNNFWASSSAGSALGAWVASSSADFNNTGMVTGSTVTVGTNESVAGMTFDGSGTGQYTLSGGSLVYSGNGAISVAAGVTATINSYIATDNNTVAGSNTDALVFTGSGTLVLAASNNIGGSTSDISSVNGGMLVLAAQTCFENHGSESINLTSGTISLAAPSAAGANIASGYFGAATGISAGPGTTASGSATLVLDSYGALAGSRTYSNGFGVNGSQSGPFTLNVTVGANISGTATLNAGGAVSGFGYNQGFNLGPNVILDVATVAADYYGFTLAGSGILNISSVHSAGSPAFMYSPTTISGGTLQIAAAPVFSTGTNLAVDGSGVLDVQKTQAIYGLGGNGTVTNSTANASTLTAWGGQFSGNIQGGNLALAKTGPGTLELSGTNSYAGGTAVNGGLVLFDSGFALPASGTITVNVGGAVASAYSTATALMTNPSLSFSGSGAIALTAAQQNENINFLSASLPNTSLGAAVNLTYGGTLTRYGATYNLGGGPGVLTYTGTIGGGLVVGGNLALTANNSANTFNTTINAGALQISADNALGSSSGTLAFGSNSGGYQLTPVLDTGANSFTLSQSLLIGQGQTAIFQEGSGGTLTVGSIALGGNQNCYFTKRGPGTLVLSGTLGSPNVLNTLTIDGGNLLLNMSGGSINDSQTFPLTMNGGTLTILGSNTGNSTQSLGTVSLGSFAGAVIAVNANSGPGTVLNIAATPSSKTAAMDFVLPSGAQSATNGITTTSTTGTYAILNGISTVNGWTDFATSTLISGGTYQVVPLNAAVNDSPSTWALATNHGNYSVDQTSTITIPSSPTPIFSTLRFTGASNQTVDLDGHNLEFNGELLNASGNSLTIMNSVPASGQFLQAGTSGQNYLAVGGPGDSNILISAAIGTVANGVTKFGADTVTFSGTNSYASATYIEGGVLSVSANYNLGATTVPSGASTVGSVYIDGATLEATATFAMDNSPSTPGNPCPRAIFLGNSGGTLDVTSGHNLTVSGPILNYETTTNFNYFQLGIGNLTKTDAGTLTLSGQSTYSGSTTIGGGILNVGGPESPGSYGPLGIGGAILFVGGTLQYSASNQYDYSPRFSTAPNQPVVIDTNGQTVTFAGAIQGAGSSLTLNDSAGNGTLILTANNTYTGGTTIDAGVLKVGSDNSILGANNLTMAGGTLDVNGFGASVNALNATAGVIGNSLSGASNAAGITVSGGGTFAGTIRDGIGPNAAGVVGTSLTLTGGVLTLQGANSYSGTTSVNGAVLVAGAVNTLSASSALSIGAVSAGTLDISGFSGQKAASINVGQYGYLNMNEGYPLTGLGNVTFNSSGSTLNVIGSITTPDLLMTYSGAESGAFNTVENNGGSLPGGDSLSYSGGSVEIVAAAPAGPSVWTFAGNGNWSVGTNWSSTPNAPNAAAAGAVFNQTTGGTTTVTIDSPQTVGTIVLGDSTGSATPTSYVLSGTSLTLNNSGSGATITVSNTGSNEIDAPVILADALGLTVSGSGSLAFGSASTLSGTGPLTLSGAGGTLILSGTDSYSGGTNVNAGTLILAANTALPAGSNLTVGAGGVLIFDPTQAVASPLNDLSRGAAGVAAVPEPGTLVLLMAGLVVGFGVWRRRGGK